MNKIKEIFNYRKLWKQQKNRNKTLTKKINKMQTSIAEDKIYIGKCHTCGCKFTYSECDTTFSRITDYKVVKCPQCEYSVVVPFIRKRYKGGKNK